MAASARDRAVYYRGLSALIATGAPASIAMKAAADGVRSPALRRAAPRVARWPRFGSAAARYLESLAALLDDRRAVIPLLALATAFWLCQYVSLWAILRAGGLAVNLADAAAVAGAAILGGTLTLLPLGTQDGISAAVLAGLGVPLARGFALALLHSVLSLWWGAIAAGLGMAWGARER